MEKTDRYQTSAIFFYVSYVSLLQINMRGDIHSRGEHKNQGWSIL